MGCCGSEIIEKFRRLQAKLAKKGNLKEAAEAGRLADRFERATRKASRIVSRMPKQRRQADKWKGNPSGWSEESKKEFWKHIGGSVTKCIKKLKDVGEISDPGAFCASLKDRMEGKKWRHEKRD